MDNKSGCTMTSPKEGSCAPQMYDPKGKCCGLLLKGALLGGIMMFLYFSASWMLLPWHMSTMSSFKNEKAVAKVLLDNAPTSGIYVLPFRTDPKVPASVDKPFAFVSVMTEGFDCVKNLGPMMAKEFALCLVLAGLLTCLLKKQSCGCPVAFSMKAGALVALAHNVPNFIFWHYPANFTLVSAADDFLAITLAGLVISKCVLKCGVEAVCAPKCKCGKANCSCGAGGACGTEKTSCGTDKPKGSCGG
jgi:hypothetical protein